MNSKDSTDGAFYGDDNAEKEPRTHSSRQGWSLDIPRNVRNKQRRGSRNKKDDFCCLGFLSTFLIGFAMFFFGMFVGALLYNVLIVQTYTSESPEESLLQGNVSSPSDSGGRPLESSVEENESEEESEDECPGFIWTDHRLPIDVIPVSYNLTIHPNISSNHLKGDVDIDLQVLHDTSLVVLHAERLNLTTYYVRVNGKRVKSEFSECETTSLWAFKLEKPISSWQEVAIGIEYEGEILPDLHGMYISTHTLANSTEKWKSAVTQFEPANARRMLPCFDEPLFKATFELSVVRERRHVVRSNTNIRVTREDAEGLYMDIFHRTVRMSTYLLAVAVLENYDYVKAVTKHTQNPIEVRLYAPKDIIEDQTDFGLDVAVRALEYFENYFNISYPLEKEDLLALDDFMEGAMENWGLVTFRDSAILYAEKTGSVQMKEYIALIVCHEIAHQWFGNLVTMEWWNDIWLNEGFANYMEYKCVEHLFPHWNIMSRFYVENVASSMEPDGQRTSRPISSPFSTNTSNIMTLFDAISYYKAAAIIHMISSLSGEENFRRAMVEYLNTYTYGNARGEQLWEIVEKHISLPQDITVQSLAKAFITQVGYPMVHVGLASAGEKIVIYNQTRFLFDVDRSCKKGQDGSAEESSSGESVEREEDIEWPLPIQYRTEHSPKVTMQWLHGKQHKLTWHLEKPSKWVIANTEGVGYFKVLYDKKIYTELTKQLKQDHNAISAIDRAMLITDAYDFAKVGIVDFDVYMNLIEYASEESDRMTWSLLNKHLKTIEGFIEDMEFSALFKDFQRSLIVKLYDRLRWTSNETFTESERGLRTEVLSMACRLRHSDCMKQASHRLQQWLRNKDKSINYVESAPFTPQKDIVHVHLFAFKA